MGKVTRYLKKVGARAQRQPAPLTYEQQVQEAARRREQIIAIGRESAGLRVVERYLSETIPPEPRDAEWTDAAMDLERLRGELRAFAIWWAAHAEDFQLPPLPTLTAAEEVELRIALYAQQEGGALANLAGS